MNFQRPIQASVRHLPLALALAACFLGPAQAGDLVPIDPSAVTDQGLFDLGAPGERFDSFIVYYRDDAAPGDDEAKAALDTRDVLSKDLTRVNARLKLKARQERRLATGGHLLRLPKSLPKSAAYDFMHEMAANPEIEFIEPNATLKALALPNDPYYTSQWGLRESLGGLNIEPAWDYSLGNGVVIAVIDTGRTAHPDLDAKTLPGYDFVSDAANARDGNGRDNDPRDPGDWNAAGECGEGAPATDSSWHGTHVAGIAAALTHNGIGVAGAAPGAYLQHVRVLGKCGGSTADIAEAIIWASGGKVAGVPDNPTPARVLNLSLGGGGSCSTTEQRAIDSARSRNSVLVVAAGNANQPATLHSPGNCNRVITVAASNRAGKRASYSNYGSWIDVAAPGGDDTGEEEILATVNEGAHGPGAAVYGWKSGTSMATPYVAGVAALLLERKPSLTPDQVAVILRNSARPFPKDCIGGCGTGIVDAAAAVTIARGGSYSAFPVSVALYALYGEGRGKVTSTPARINCGSDCSARFAKGGTVTLRATPVPGYAFSSWSGACRGTATTCTLTSLNEGKAAFATFKIPVGQLWNGSVRRDLHPIGGVPLLYKLNVPAGATNLRIRISGGSGDADLYVRRDQQPTTEKYDCRPWKVGNNETCTWAAPVAGAYYAMINPGSSFSGVQLDVRYTTPVATGGERLSRTTPERNIAIPKGGARYYRFAVPVDAVNLKIQTQGGSGDVDLYLRHDEVPTFSRYDCRPYKTGNNESCEVEIPTSGMYYIMLYADSAASGVTLSASYAGGKRLTVTYSGSGAGTIKVKHHPGGESVTSCAALPCRIPLTSGVVYALSAQALPGSHFPGWYPNQCDAILPDGRCRLTMNKARGTTARFDRKTGTTLALTVKRSGSGTGLVAVRRLANGSVVDACTDYPCRVAAPAVGSYDFIALPSAGSDFTGWVTSQCDSVLASGDCRVRINGPTTVTAKFSPK